MSKYSEKKPRTRNLMCNRCSDLQTVIRAFSILEYFFSIAQENIIFSSFFKNFCKIFIKPLDLKLDFNGTLIL